MTQSLWLKEIELKALHLEFSTKFQIFYILAYVILLQSCQPLLLEQDWFLFLVQTYCCATPKSSTLLVCAGWWSSVVINLTPKLSIFLVSAESCFSWSSNIFLDANDNNQFLVDENNIHTESSVSKVYREAKSIWYYGSLVALGEESEERNVMTLREESGEQML